VEKFRDRIKVCSYLLYLLWCVSLLPSTVFNNCTKIFKNIN
jgi:hypothetical protein